MGDVSTILPTTPSSLSSPSSEAASTILETTTASDQSSSSATEVTSEIPINTSASTEVSSTASDNQSTDVVPSSTIEVLTSSTPSAESSVLSSPASCQAAQYQLQSPKPLNPRMQSLPSPAPQKLSRHSSRPFRPNPP